MTTPESANTPLSTADIFDSCHERLQVCPLQFRSFGLIESFCGPCETLQAHEDHYPVHEALKRDGRGKVLFVDGGGSLRVGILGDRLAALGLENGWIGAVIVGAVRDSHGIDRLNFGVKALGATARRTFSATQGKPNVTLKIADCDVMPGNWIYADRDCVLIGRGMHDVRTAV